jgi:hypothetical protein
MNKVTLYSKSRRLPVVEPPEAAAEPDFTTGGGPW